MEGGPNNISEEGREVSGIGQRKRLGVVIVAALILAVVIWAYLEWIKPPINQLAERVIRHEDPSYQEMIHLQAWKDKLVVYYRTNDEVIAVLLGKNMLGYEVVQHLLKHNLQQDKAISWNGNGGDRKEVPSLLHGIVNNPEVTQVILVSEKSKGATIIRSGATSIWFSFLDDQPQMPITIRATDKSGKALYETGDMEYWGERKQMQEAKVP